MSFADAITVIAGVYLLGMVVPALLVSLFAGGAK